MLEISIDDEPTITHAEQTSQEAPIFDSEDDMLLALQGSWIWEEKADLERGFFNNS